MYKLKGRNTTLPIYSCLCRVPKKSLKKKKTLKLISESSKVAGHKVNTKKSNTGLYTNNEYVQIKSKNTMPFIITLKKINHLDKNLRGVQYL